MPLANSTRAVRAPLRATLCACASLAVLSGTAWADKGAQERSADTFHFRPSIGIEVNATDNVRREVTNKDSDIVAVPRLGLDMDAKTDDLDLFVNAGLVYHSFFENSSLDRFSGSLLAHATLTAVPNLLFIDANAQISDEFLNIADVSATGLPNGTPQARIFNYQLSPYVKAILFGEVDSLVRARVSAVRTDTYGLTIPTPTLGNSLAYQAAAVFGNGERGRVVEWRLSGDYTREERDGGREFTSSDGLLGLTFHVTPRIDLLARGGYEELTDPGITPIRGEIWAGGALYKLGDASFVTGEYRHRFDRDSWFGKAELAMTSRLFVSANYEERVESQQLRLGRSLSDLFNQQASIPPPPAPAPFSLDEDFVDQVFYARDAQLGARYITPERSFALAAKLSRREFETLATDDKTAGVTATYSERFHTKLTLNLVGDYNARLDAPTGLIPVDRYTASSGLVYLLSETASARLQYTWSQTTGVDTITENLISASMAKSF